MTHTFLSSRCTAAVVTAALSLSCMAAQAVTLRVGPSAGTPGSQCDHATPLAAIQALPQDGALHVIELSSSTFAGQDAAIEVAGKRVHIVSRFSGTTCSNVSGAAFASLVATETTLAGGRTVVVRDGGELILESVEISGSQRGAVAVREADLVLRDTLIRDNSTSGNSSGAAIVIEGGNLSIDDSILIDNHTSASGGAVFCSRTPAMRATVSIIDSAFRRNRANSGGAVFLFQGCRLDAQFSVFAGNHALLDGGAIGTQPRADTDNERNRIELTSFNEFTGNTAARDGGAIQLSAGNELRSLSRSHVLFDGNHAGRGGGALNVVGGGPAVSMASALFMNNDSAERGGAIAVEDRLMMLFADCAEDDTIDNQHCAQFLGNSVAPGSQQSRRGGTLYVGAGANLNIGRYAFRDSHGPAVNGSGGGVIALIDNQARLVLDSALVFDTRPAPDGQSNLFQVNTGGVARLQFNTMVDSPDSTVLFVQAGGRAELVGNIIAGNAAGIAGPGTVTGTCNNAQLGTAPVPTDPGFVTTPAGRYHLSPNSAMRDRALTCDPDRLPAGFRAPAFDLDGRSRIEDGADPMAIDLGAFEFELQDDVLFRGDFQHLSTP